MLKMEELTKILAKDIQEIFNKSYIDINRMEEIRLRINCPVIIIYDNKEKIISEGTFTVQKKHINETMEYISNYSLYAFEDEIKQGFITVNGGHRVGIAGQAVLESERVKGIKYISFINIRISHQIFGCSDEIIKYLYETGEIKNVLIISAPGCGKTTLLRDLIRQVSDGNKYSHGISVGVVDERSEIAGCYLGIPQNNIGIRTDVLDCCPKAEGMMMLIRSMSPKVIAVDEIGSEKDINAIRMVMNCGCHIIATVHAGNYEELKIKTLFKEFIREKIFDRYIVLYKDENNKVWMEIRDNEKILKELQWRN